MMSIHASAPGKLVMAGDYAVLEGAPAVVLAVDHRARVELSDSDDDAFCIDAPDLGIRRVHGRLDHGVMDWAADDASAGRLNLVASVLQFMARHGASPTPLHVALDTREFFADDGKGKLGLGSSAALTVALAGAMYAAQGQAVPDLVAMITMHRRMQGGRGSGLDIAAALLGGALVYRLHGSRPEANRVSWPRGLAFCCVWSGRPASTGKALEHLALWRRSHARAYNSYMNELTADATAVAAALEADDASTMIQGMASYADGLEHLGDATGIDIMCAEHRALAGMAHACSVAYKTCGAGGGDVGVAVSTDADRLDHFARQAGSAGFHVLETGVDESGLSVPSATIRHGRTPWTKYA